MKKEKLLTRREIANYFNVVIGTVNNWQYEGKIKPYCRINGRPRYRLEDLQHLLTPKTESNAE